MENDRDIKKLSPREMEFVRAYVRMGSAIKAMAAAGYSPDPSGASKLLKRPRISDAIDKIRDEVLSEAKLSHAKALERAKQFVDEAREKGQYTAVAKLEENLLKLSGLGPLISDRVEIAVEEKVDIREVLNEARSRVETVPPIPAEFRRLENEQDEKHDSPPPCGESLLE